MAWRIALPNAMAGSAHEDQEVRIEESLVIAKVVRVTPRRTADVTLATMSFVNEFSRSLPFFSLVKVFPVHTLFMQRDLGFHDLALGMSGMLKEATCSFSSS